MKKPVLPYLVHRTARGNDYWYFERAGDRIRLPCPDDENFFTAYNDAKTGRAAIPAKRNFEKLIAVYLASEKFSGLKPRTRKDYRDVLDYIRAEAGKDDPSRMIRRDVIDAMNANLHRKKFANYLQQMFSILYEFGIDRGWTDKNPAKGVSKFKTGDGYKAWPEPLLERFGAACDPNTRLVFELCLNTGQRIGDVLKMKWSDLEIVDGHTGINVKQNKTGTELWIPLTADLEAYLATVERSLSYICLGPKKNKLSENTMRDRFNKVRQAVDGQGYVLHGLRYTAAHRLAEAGCSDAQIAAITGHKSAAMVAKYSRKSNQRALALGAQKRLNST